MMYAINNITIVGGREKRRESLRLIAPRKSGPIGCLSEGPGSGKDQKRVWTSEWRATRWLDGIRLEVKCQTQLRRGFLSTATLIFRWVFSIDELGLRNQDQRVLLYIVSNGNCVNPRNKRSQTAQDHGRCREYWSKFNLLTRVSGETRETRRNVASCKSYVTQGAKNLCQQR